MAGEAVSCGAANAPRRVPALIAMGPRRRAPGARDERGALVPVHRRLGPVAAELCAGHWRCDPGGDQSVGSQVR